MAQFNKEITNINEPAKEKIVEFLKGTNGSQIVSEIAKATGISTQKASALCRQLVNDDILKSEEIKVKDKGKIKTESIIIRVILYAPFVSFVLWFSASYFEIVIKNLGENQLSFWNLFSLIM